jgi:hypothetical protein
MIDCIVGKRYPIYYNEYSGGGNGRVIRSRETVEVIQQRQMDQFNEQAKVMFGESKKSYGSEQQVD